MLLSAGCNIRALSVVDAPGAYLALLDSVGPIRTDRGVAIGTQLMSDAGTYEASGSLPDSVIARLQSSPRVQEICREEFVKGSVPVCHAKQAGTEVRFSKLLTITSTTVDVFVGQGTLAPPDSSWLAFATAYRCTLVRKLGQWKLSQCKRTMIT